SHPRTVFGCRGFQQSPIDLDFHVSWEQPVENLLRRLLEDVIRLRLGLFQIAAAERQYFFDDHALLDDRLEFVVDDVDRIDFGVRVRLDDGFRNILRVTVIEVRKDVHELDANRHGPASKEIATFAADRGETDRLVFVFANENLRRANDVGIERAAESPVCSDDDQQNFLFRPDFQERMRDILQAHCEIAEDSFELVRIRTRAENTLLCAPQL